MVSTFGKFIKSQAELIVELVGFGCAAYGIALISVTAALIIGGIAIIIAVERRPSGGDKP